MKNELTFERQHRTAPARHFSGGYTHGPIESDLPPLRPVREFVGGAFVIALVCGVLFIFGAMTP